MKLSIFCPFGLKKPIHGSIIVKCMLIFSIVVVTHGLMECHGGVTVTE